GAAWGAYSLRGRSAAADPLAATASNFARTAPVAAALAGAALWRGDLVASSHGAALAIASGAIASRLGYTLWYAALPLLGAARAPLVQLLVPVLSAAGGIALLGETVTTRLIAGGGAILGGVVLALIPARRRT